MPSTTPPYWDGLTATRVTQKQKSDEKEDINKSGLKRARTSNLTQTRLVIARAKMIAPAKGTLSNPIDLLSHYGARQTSRPQSSSRASAGIIVVSIPTDEMKFLFLPLRFPFLCFFFPLYLGLPIRLRYSSRKEHTTRHASVNIGRVSYVHVLPSAWDIRQTFCVCR